jgi:O-antigen/teichoic acid export membrane protein
MKSSPEQPLVRTSLLKRAIILSFSRFANQAIILLSPMLLVRILPVSEYGSYREFMLYAGLVGSFVLLGVPQSLAFFLPKYPNRERVWITQTTLFILAFTTVAVIAVNAFGGLIRANTSFDFLIALQLYVVFFINLDFVEYYWIGKKRTEYVFYYSSGRLFARLIVIVVSALLSKSASGIVLSLVFLEAIRCLLVLIYAIHQRWFTKAMTRATILLQMSYFLPLGGGGLIEVLNTRAGMLFVSTMLGAEALAFYTIGAFATQIVNILRGAIADVIFPEIVELRHAEPRDALPLWQQATVWYCVLLFPVAVLFFYYSDVIVTVLFTKEYSTAIPIFSTFAFVLFLYCFDFHLPLRVQNANRYFMLGNTIALILNVVLLYPAYLMLGLVGPVIAFIVSRVVFTVYLSYRVSKIYKVALNHLLDWKDVGRVTVASFASLPVLVVGKLAIENLLLRGVLFGTAYLLIYIFVLRMLGVVDIFEMLHAFIKPDRELRNLHGKDSPE